MLSIIIWVEAWASHDGQAIDRRRTDNLWGHCLAYGWINIVKFEHQIQMKKSSFETLHIRIFTTAKDVFLKLIMIFLSILVGQCLIYLSRIDLCQNYPISRAGGSRVGEILMSILGYWSFLLMIVSSGHRQKGMSELVWTCGTCWTLQEPFLVLTCEKILVKTNVANWIIWVNPTWLYLPMT